ncbi:MAG: hypothetical protein RBT68_11465 [Spirochaetia bacterium]|jgi:hypothetical protein|nr:hypothetical protein [Spirochaetia bacterium]
MSRIAASRRPRPVSPSAIARAPGLLAAWAGRLAVGTAVLILATACWLPTFDPDVSGSELTVRKLGDPVAQFTLENFEADEAEAFWFLPQRLEVPMTGLLISERGSSLGFYGVGFQPGFDTGYLLALKDRRQNTYGPGYFAQMAPNGTSEASIVAELPTINNIDVSISSFPEIPLAAGTITLGFGAVARPGTADYELSIVVWDATPPGPPFFEMIGWFANQPAFTPAGPIVFPDASSVTVPGKFLYSVGDFNYFYLSCGLIDGTRAIFRWSDIMMAPVQFPEDHGPLIGGLADGRLLAEKDGLLSVLDQDLGLLFAFRSGSLRFVHERWDAVDLKMITVFTRTLYVRKDGGEGTLRVEIYEIPSSELKKLGD